ncbi:hypothetical protein [Corynebacterium liangguodongii]|uniref:hypothetical protein n=1 Tax=Corynebacterium liangguodongii TaxID=2079535 RepID=UPI001304BD66|nr:hypothetical protein [Corynebacterium liangguodongii]
MTAKVYHTSLLLSIATATIVLGSACAVGTLSGNAVPLSEIDAPPTSRSSFDEAFIFIASSNIPTWCILVSGVLSFGLTTVVGAFGLGLYLGLSFAISVNAIGLRAAIGSTWAYSPFEFFGLFLASVVGIFPTFILLMQRDDTGVSFAARWWLAVKSTFPFVLTSFALIWTGILIEALVVSNT